MSLQDIMSGLNSVLETGITEENIRNSLRNIQRNPLSPQLDMIDTDDNLFVYVELPGVEKKSICLDFFNNNMLIRGEKRKQYVNDAYRNEIMYGRCERKVTLPFSVTQKENVSVKYTDGILIIDIDKKKEGLNRFQIGVGRGVNSLD